VLSGRYSLLVHCYLTKWSAHWWSNTEEGCLGRWPQADILLEPVRRDSGPAIVAGATYALHRGDDSVLVALAADHVVTDPVAFAKVCVTAGEAAQEDRIVMFGVEPTRAATEYGYIRPGSPVAPGLFGIDRICSRDASALTVRPENSSVTATRIPHLYAIARDWILAFSKPHFATARMILAS
jgi:hypothetical protein